MPALKWTIVDNRNLSNVVIDLNPVIKDFYSDHVEGIKCLIGENGSGKTNCIEYIIKNSIMNDKPMCKFIYYSSMANDRLIEEKENLVNIAEGSLFNEYINECQLNDDPVGYYGDTENKDTMGRRFATIKEFQDLMILSSGTLISS